MKAPTPKKGLFSRKETLNVKTMKKAQSKHICKCS